MLDLIEQTRTLVTELRSASREERQVIVEKIRKLKESRHELRKKQLLDMRQKSKPVVDFIDEQ